MQIALLIFCFLLVAGSFSAWRRSPLYSLKATFKLAGSVALIVAAVAGAVYAILNSSLTRSPVAQGIAGFIAIMALGCGASVLIVRVTDSHVAVLPPSTRLVTFNRRKIDRWLWRLVAFLFINAIAALALPPDWTWLPVGLAGFVLLASGPALSISYMMARRNDRGMSEVIANPWVHWQYTPEQWAQWAANQREWEIAREGPWRWSRVVLFVLLCAGLFGLGALFTGAGLEENAIILGALNGMVVVFVLVAYWFKRTNFDRRYRRLIASAPESWFGDEGVFCNGTYMPWILSGRYLLNANAATDQPARLLLTFESFNGSTSIQITHRIAIPSGGVADLPLLQEKLRARCPTASVHLGSA